MSAQGVAQRPPGNISAGARQEARARHRFRAAATGLVGAAGTAFVMVGVPLVLLRLGGVLPIERDLLTPGLLLRPDDGTLLLVLLLGLAWVAWGLVTVSLLLEIWAVASRRPVPSLRGLGPAQRAAANMVASMTVAIAMFGPGAAASAQGTPQSLAAAIQSTKWAGDDVAAPGPSALPLLERSRTTDSETLPLVEVQRHDTLWLLAELHLGDGARFAEIVALNQGAPQPHGRALGEDGRLRPGWRLRLPADARLDVVRPHVHHVTPGESLWEIAEEELGDGSRYPEIFRANRGDRQPDGRSLRDPDLILPNWELVVPGAGDRRPGDASQPASRGDDPLVDLDRGHPSPGSGDAPGGARVEGEPPTPPAAEASADADIDRPLPTLDRSPSDAAPEPGEPEPSRLSIPTPTVDRAGFDAVLGVLDDPAVGLPAQGVLGVLALAGLAREVAHRRRDGQRRSPTRPATVVPDDARRVGELALGALDHGLVDLLDSSLRQLAAAAAATGRRPPALRLMRASARGIVLELMDEHAPAIAPFRCTAPARWELDPGQLSQATVDHPRAYPALVTVGFDGGETVLVDLVEVGVLRVTGESDDVRDVRAALNADVAFGPAAGLVDHVVDLPDPILARSQAVGSVEVTGVGTSAASAAGLLAERARVGTSQRGDAGTSGGPTLDPLERSGVPAAHAPDTLDGALAEDPPLVLMTETAQLPSLPSGVGLIVADPGAGGQAAGGEGPVDPSGVVLHVTGDRGVLLPGDVPLTPPRLPLADERSIAALLDATDRPLPSPTVAPERSASARVTDPEPTGRPAPRLLLLGEVIVLGASGRADRSRIGRLAETTAFVHLNPGSRPSQLQGALWPGRAASPQSCRQMLSRTRTWLGRDERNRPYLMAFSESDGRLRLRDAVSSDWQDFRRLADAGLADPEDRAQLTAALALVRGRPFGPLAGRGVGWADVHVDEMLGWITDVAHELALRHLHDGRRDLARSAVLRALTTEAESDVLHELLARLGDPTVGRASA